MAVLRLMLWNMEWRNDLFDALPAEKQAALNFDDIFTASYKDPIFNNVRQHDWIDHILYSACGTTPWLTDAKVIHTAANGKPLWKASPAASDHCPVVVTLTV